MSYYTVDNAVATPGYQALFPHRTAHLVYTTEWSWTLLLRTHWNLVACRKGQRAGFHQRCVISPFLWCSLQGQLCQPRSPRWSLVPAFELQQCHSFCLSEETEVSNARVGAGLQTPEWGGVRWGGNVSQMSAITASEVWHIAVWFTAVALGVGCGLSVV